MARAHRKGLSASSGVNAPRRCHALPGIAMLAADRAGHMLVWVRRPPADRPILVGATSALLCSAAFSPALVDIGVLSAVWQFNRHHRRSV